MNWFSVIIGAAILLVFIFSVVSFVKSLIVFIRKKKNKNSPPEEVPDVNDSDDNSNKEV